ncbi:MAG: ABC transporter permease [Bifidobacteriaceae bacterium]|jgi:ABC-2 type transport system permease protein|nr:ABC transporter permease [Bifidobacteriaceae bacterium]
MSQTTNPAGAAFATGPTMTNRRPSQSAKRPLSRLAREANAVIAVAARDITITLKSPGMLAMGLIMPLIMMGLIGGNLMQNMAGGLGFGLGQFMLVGMLVTMLFMLTTMGMVTLVDDSDGNYSAELLVSPVSRYAIVTGKIAGSAFTGLVSCLGVLAVGLVMGITLAPWQLLVLLILAPLFCLSGGALAMIVMGLIKNNKTANMAVMLLTMPQMFLAGAIIPVNQSTGILWLASRLMPMTYCVDLGRAVVYAGSPEYDSVVMFNPAVNLACLIGLTLVCLVVGTVLYARSEKNR